ncbi:MAG: hypothetical protein M3439_04495 [Chloroflexota bacterium]|nr:hypothetical protein [Chloroflexota bacterium]
MADDGVRGTGSTERPDEGRGTIQMRQRLRAAGLALAILVLGLGSIVAVTEYEVRAGAGPRLLTASDVIAALVEQGVAVEDDDQLAHHPLLGIAGTTLVFGTASIDVYVFATVAARVEGEQVIQRHVMQLQSLTSERDEPFRVTSARNVLLLYHADSAVVAASIHEAARSLTSDARR